MGLDVVEVPGDLGDIGRSTASTDADPQLDRSRREQLLDAVDTLSFNELAAAYGFAAFDEAVDAARRERLLVVPIDERPRVPAFQFDAEGAPLAVVTRTVDLLRRSGMGPWQTLAWFTSPSADLDGARPMDETSAGPTLTRAAVRHLRRTRERRAHRFSDAERPEAPTSDGRHEIERVLTGDGRFDDLTAAQQVVVRRAWNQRIDERVGALDLRSMLGADEGTWAECDAEGRVVVRSARRPE